MSTPEVRSLRGGVVSAVLQTLIVGAMAVCVSIALAQFEHALLPAWRVDYIPVLSFGVAVIASTTTRLLQRAQLPLPRYGLRAIELVVLFFIARSVLSVIRGPDYIANYDPVYGRDDRELLMLAAILGAVWLHSAQLMHCLLETSDVVPLTDRAWMQDLSNARQLARQTLVTILLLSGGGMLLATIVIRTALRNSGAAAETAVWHILVYFGLGLILLSQTRLTMLRSRWVWDRVAITPQLSARWIAATLLILCGVAAVALALPAQYPLGLVSTLNYLLTLLVALISLIYFVVTVILTSLLRLFFPNAQSPDRPLPPVDLFTPGAAAPPPISEFIQALAFWLIFAIVIGYLIYQYLHRNPVLMEGLQRLLGWPRWACWWRRMRRWLGLWGKRMTNALQVRRAARSVPAARSGAEARHWIDLRRLSPREQVQFYYRALLRRGEERGLARRPAQTPAEYARELQRRVPEVDTDVTALTSEFVEARYSRHSIEPERVSAVRRYWARIKAALKRK